jgi:hypothetical protein
VGRSPRQCGSRAPEPAGQSSRRRRTRLRARAAGYAARGATVGGGHGRRRTREIKPRAAGVPGGRCSTAPPQQGAAMLHAAAGNGARWHTLAAQRHAARSCHAHVSGPSVTQPCATHPRPAWASRSRAPMGPPPPMATAAPTTAAALLHPPAWLPALTARARRAHVAGRSERRWGFGGSGAADCKGLGAAAGAPDLPTLLSTPCPAVLHHQPHPSNCHSRRSQQPLCTTIPALLLPQPAPALRTHRCPPVTAAAAPGEQLQRALLGRMHHHRQQVEDGAGLARAGGALDENLSGR